ncbi:MAG: hypothetical protein M0R40_09725 [Firmicutes bacterium]|nr:hypothetical protein [Bacillota bacterium]
MSEVTFTFELPSDSDGYVTFECPFCEAEFKLSAAEYQDDEKPVDELFCPYCGLTHNKDHFYTKETIAMAQEVAQNYMIDQINSAFGKMAKNINKSKFLKMSFKPLKKGNVRELKERDTTEEIFKCKVCGRTEKVIYCAGFSKVFCAYCGVDL